MTEGKISVRDQYRIIHDPKDEKATIIPQMPLLVVLDNEIIGEAKTIRGAATIVIGNEYLDAEDAIVEWHMRVDIARREAMKALQYDIEAVVFDTKKGVIENNYAADPKDSDYLIDEDEEILSTEKIIIDSDRLFLLSLAKIGAIRILERADSYLLRPQEKWTQISENGGEQKCCDNCVHRIEDDEKWVCPVYAMNVDKMDGNRCGSFSVETEEGQKEYTGGEYMDVCMEYGADELIRVFGGA